MKEAMLNNFIDIINKIKVVDKFAFEQVYLNLTDLVYFLRDLDYRRIKAAVRNKIESELNLNDSNKAKEFIDYATNGTKFLLIKTDYSKYKIVRSKDYSENKDVYYGYVDFAYSETYELSNLYNRLKYEMNLSYYSLNIKCVDENMLQSQEDKIKTLSIYELIENYKTFSSKNKKYVLLKVLAATESWISLDSVKKLLNTNEYINFYKKLKELIEEKYKNILERANTFVQNKIKNSTFYVVEVDGKFYFRRFNYYDMSNQINFEEISIDKVTLFDVEYFTLSSMYNHKNRFNYYANGIYSTEEVQKLLDNTINLLIDNFSYEDLEKEIKEGLDISNDFDELNEDIDVAANKSDDEIIENQDDLNQENVFYEVDDSVEEPILEENDEDIVILDDTLLDTIIDSLGNVENTNTENDTINTSEVNDVVNSAENENSEINNEILENNESSLNEVKEVDNENIYSVSNFQKFENFNDINMNGSCGALIKEEDSFLSKISAKIKGLFEF